jgi:RING finger/CHY zinc finger protein 1
MTDTWRKLDEEVAATPMPEIYLTKMVSSRPDALYL